MAAGDSISSLEGGLDADRSGSVTACAIIFIVSCTLFMALRWTSQRVAKRAIFVEDWLMVAAYVMMMGLCANVICSVVYGCVGRHEEWVLANKPTAMITWAQTLFITEVMYGILIATEKTSILLLYLRIFHIQRWFRFLVYFMIAWVWAWAFSELLVAIFQCHPIAYQWNTELHGTCIDRLAFYRWISVPNIIHDVALLAVPAPMVWRLQISRQQKIALSSVFLLASFGCIASIIRFYYFFELNAFSDDNWASVELMSWTCAEPGVIFICACAPALWPMIRKTLNLKTDRQGKHSGGDVSGRGMGSQGPAWSGLGPRQPLSDNDDKFILLQDVSGTIPRGTFQ